MSLILDINDANNTTGVEDGKEALKLPGYGRNVQNMVNVCLGLKDAQERSACAAAIVATMQKMKDKSVPIKTLWDHFFYIADYKISPEEVKSLPEGYVLTKMSTIISKPLLQNYDELRSDRHYGRHIKDAINAAAEMEESPARDKLVQNIANQMKRDFIHHNNSSVDDERIFSDLYRLSGRRINVPAGSMRLIDIQTLLNESLTVVVPNNNNNNNNNNNSSKKKKKKKK